MKNLALVTWKNIYQTLIKNVKNGKPIIGICLGFQLLFSSGQEFKNTNGLNLIKGSVKLLPKKITYQFHMLDGIIWLNQIRKVLVSPTIKTIFTLFIRTMLNQMIKKFV